MVKDVDQCLAVDIGATKLAAAVVTDRGRLLARRSVGTPRVNDPEIIFEALAGAVRDLRADATSTRVCGVGCGGPMDTDTVSPLNIPAWRRFSLRARLEDLIGLPTFVENDAKALALGEGWRGRAVGVDNYIAMVVSTGVGGGIVIDGRLLDGEAGNSGHIGHVVVVPGGRRCTCGARGCLEAEASGRAIAALTGEPAERAGADVVERTGRLVGRAVGSVANLLDLRLAVVAGSVALGFGGPFFEAAQAEVTSIAKLAFSIGTQIVRGGLGADGPLVGAAAVGWRGLRGDSAWRLA